MSTPQQPDPAKLVIGFFMKDKKHFEAVAKTVEEKFGPVDIISRWMPFDYTDYYASEMGSPLFRRMMVFKALIDQTDLLEIKLATNALEKDYTENGKRQINIDPGYMLRERFVLATGKNFTHRIYIGRGIYADLTLIFKKGAFQILPWTYPDYADKNMLAFLEQVRNKYINDVKTM